MTKLSHARRLAISTAEAQQLIANLRDVLAGDDQAISDTVEGETDLFGAMDAAVARIAEIDALSLGIKEMIAAANARNDRLGRQKQSIRDAIQSAMGVARLSRHEAPAGSVSMRSVPPSVVITDEGMVPDKYKVPQPPKIDKRALLAALKEGGTGIPGAELSNGSETISIRLT